MRDRPLYTLDARDQKVRYLDVLLDPTSAPADGPIWKFVKVIGWTVLMIGLMYVFGLSFGDCPQCD